jgi:hypothetical protein
VLLAVRHVGDEEWYGERVTRRKARIYDETGTTYSQERSGAESELPSGKSNSLRELQAGMSELLANYEQGPIYQKESRLTHGKKQGTRWKEGELQVGTGELPDESSK